MENEGAGPDPMYYDEALLANHGEGLATDHQGFGEVNYLTLEDFKMESKWLVYYFIIIIFLVIIGRKMSNNNAIMYFEEND